MSYEKVTDHVDIISSQLWKQLLNDFIDRCRGYFRQNPNLLNIAYTLVTTSIPTSGKPVKPSLYNNMVTACKELLKTLDKESPSGLRNVTSGDIVFASDINALIDCLNEIPPPPPITPTIYLFNVNDWDTAKNYITTNSFIFVNYDINTLTNTEVRNLVSALPVLFVNMIDTQPFHILPCPAFYQVFYNTLTPHGAYYPDDYVIDTCFKNILGEILYVSFDYIVFDEYKVTGTQHWGMEQLTLPTLLREYFSYKMYESGAIIEIPFDGFWKNVSWMGQFIHAMAKCLFNMEKPTTILYLGYYTSDTPSYHECYPIDNCWQQYASMKGYQLVDLRGKQDV
jgi:hypothetical protein